MLASPLVVEVEPKPVLVLGKPLLANVEEPPKEEAGAEAPNPLEEPPKLLFVPKPLDFPKPDEEVFANPEVAGMLPNKLP